LDRLTPKTNILKLFEEVVRDEWNSSRKELKLQEKRLSQKLGELQQRKDLLTTAFLYENKIDGETYERQSRLIAEGQLESRNISEIELDVTLDFARQLIQSLAEFWSGLEPSQKPTLQQAIFPDGIRYGDGFIGTAKKSLIFSALYNNQRTEVDPKNRTVL